MILFLIFQLYSGFANAAPCTGACVAELQSLAAKDAEISRIKIILQKNEDYLKKNTNLSTSISVKITSNILISKLNLETFQNERAVIEKHVKDKGCGGCKIQKNTKEI